MTNQRIATRLGAGTLTAALAALILSAPLAAVAQTPAAPTQDWEACLGGSAPSTENVPAQQIDQDAGVLSFGSQAIMDTDPTGDQVLIDFADEVPNDELIAFAKNYGLDIRLNSPHSDEANVFVADVPEGAVPAIKECMEKTAPEGLIEGIEENIEYSLLGVSSQAWDNQRGAADTLEQEAPEAQFEGAPDDPLYQFQWNFDQIGAEDAWRTATGKDVVVAVIDTGVAMENAPERGITRPKDLDGTRYVPGYDFVDKSDFAWDGHGHGTHVAGTIAQTTDNAYGVAGLAFNAKIMPLRVLNSQGFGQVSDIADAIRFAADNGADVINMSLGGPLPSLVMSRAIKYANKKGVTVVAAAGNAGKRGPSYPAAYKGVIAVAATQFDQNTTFYSQWGPFVDIAAPGGNTRVDQNGDGRPDGVMQQTLKEGKTDEHDFILYMGTSMASPHVAAAAAMVIGQGVTNPDDVKSILLDSADDSLSDRFKSDKEFKERYGAGLLQVDKAVAAASNTVRAQTVTHGSWRFAGGLLVALLALISVRRRDLLKISGGLRPGVLFTSALSASGLFILPLIFGYTGATGGIASALAHPLAQANSIFSSASFTTNPVFASALIPLLAVGFLGGSKRWKFLASGIALGMAGFLMVETLMLSADVQWIPGTGILDRIWLGANALVSFAIGYFSLKRY